MLENQKPPEHESNAPTIPKAGWPSLFIEPAHPHEEKILFCILHRNKKLFDVYFAVRTMQVNYLVFQRNFIELERLHNEFDHPLNFREIALQTNKGKTIALEAMTEFTRLLHNYLASIYMLRDVTNAWVRRHIKDSEFLEIYQNEITNRFSNNVQAKFLEDLRNFTLHRTLPLSIPELIFQEISEHALNSSLRLVLVKSHLLEWDKWSTVGKKLFDMQPEGEIDIMSICRQYNVNVTEFHQWLFWQVRELFTPQINQINSVIETLRNYK